MPAQSQLSAAWSLVQSEWAEQVYLLPRGDRSQQTLATAVVWEDQEEGTNEVTGDGKVLNKRHGRRTRHSAKIDLDRSYGVEERDSEPWLVVVFKSEADRTSFDAGDTSKGRIYAIKRRIGTDRDVETYLLVHNSAGFVRRVERKG